MAVHARRKAQLRLHDAVPADVVWSTGAARPRVNEQPQSVPERCVGISRHGQTAHVDTVSGELRSRVRPVTKLTLYRPQLYCDVRDIAKLHLLAAEKDAARGQRYLASAGSFRFARMAEAIRSDPEISSKNRERIPSSSGQRAAQHDIMVDTSRVERDLGIKWRPFELTVRDTARALFKLEETMNR